MLDGTSERWLDHGDPTTLVPLSTLIIAADGWSVGTTGKGNGVQPSSEPRGDTDGVPAGRLLTRRGRPARVALVHDWFASYYGSERVVEQILACFPEADLFALVDLLGDDRGFLGGRPVTTSFIQRLPFANPRFRHYLPLFPLAIEQFDLSGYDLVLSSSHAFAKGVLTGPDQLHVSYVHAPIRYAWEYQHEYLRESGLDKGVRGALVRWVLHRLRIWDHRTANGVDHFIANSEFIARRIHKIYRRDSVVIHPPVRVDDVATKADKEDHYLAVSRFVPYKHAHTIVAAFRALPQRKLLVIGDGPGLEAARRDASGNVTFLGFQPDQALRRHMASAKALIFAAEEDFGITPVEAQAAGTPVIAFAGGGALETVRGLDQPRPTGVFFGEQTPAAIAEAVEQFERSGGVISGQDCRDNTLAFRPERFRQEFVREVEAAWVRHGGKVAGHQIAADRDRIEPGAR
jgi:glycosyltransferase involved in cell wall biosynthesis